MRIVGHATPISAAIVLFGHECSTAGPANTSSSSKMNLSFQPADLAKHRILQATIALICLGSGLLWVLNRPPSLVAFVPAATGGAAAAARRHLPAACQGHISGRSRDWQVNLPAWYSPDEPPMPISWRGSPKPGVIDAAGSTGQNGEDQYAFNNFFYNTWSGSYLEMGALDGITFSNTLWLHKSLGWRGLLIEGSPQSYEALVRNRPGDIRSHAAICEQRSLVHYIHPEGSQHPAVFGIYEFMSPAFKAKWYGAIANATMTEITCLPLSELLASFGITHIDLFSLDVEGGELMVLRSIDFSCITFNVLVVEEDGSNPDKDKAVRQLLGSKGYDYHSHVATNSWFVRRGWRPSAQGAL